MVPDSATLDTIVRSIVDLVHPLRIILFGSAVRGEMGPDSDLDLLIVVRDGVHRRQTAQMLYRQMPDTDIPLEFVVASQDDVQRYGDSVGLILRQALREGKELYAA